MKALKKYKIDQKIDLDDFGSLVPSEAKLAISSITRVSETKFKINRIPISGALAGVQKDAGFIIEKNGVITNSKGSFIKGLKITPYGLHMSQISYSSKTHTFNAFIISANSKRYLFKDVFYNYSKN